MEGPTKQYHLSWKHDDFPRGAYCAPNGLSMASKAGKHDNNARFFAKQKLTPGSTVYVVFSGSYGDILGDEYDGVFPAFHDIESAKNYIYNHMDDLFDAKEYDINNGPDDIIDKTATSLEELKRMIVNSYGNNINRYGDSISVTLDGYRYHDYYYGIIEFMIVN
tara:strand:+ start:5154 stop:5645 length:492 start_codon:yes stop_codon:yes gene_type:complete